MGKNNQKKQHFFSKELTMCLKILKHMNYVLEWWKLLEEALTHDKNFFQDHLIIPFHLTSPLRAGLST